MEKTVRIEKIIAGGFGLARQDDGPVILTRFVLPGETVEVRETAFHRGYNNADLVEVVVPSPDRVAPPCPLYARCGGCDFQHCSPSAQLELKTAIVRETLKRAKIPFPPEALQPALPSPDLFHYRHRIRLKVSEDGRLGFFQHGSNALVATDNCPVATGLLNHHLKILAAPGLLTDSAHFISEIEVQHSPADAAVFLLLHVRPGRAVDRAALTGLASSLPEITGIWLRQKSRAEEIKGTDGFLRQDSGPDITGHPFTLCWSPDCFFQVNAEQNTRLIAEVVRLAGDTDGRHTLDLFCGMGNFSLPLALNGALVTGIERNPAGVTWARTNCTRAGINNARFIANDVMAAMRKLARESGQADIIILDPPRQGIGRQAGQLALLNPARIIYISCDPATLARDLALITREGYRVATLHPVDMFPQTHHIETVVLLEKN